MPYLKIYIHFVWCTKNREPFLNTIESRKLVWNHIRENAIKKDIYIDFVNGFEDHCHCLISLGINQSIDKIMQLIKGESSFWINKNNHLFPNMKRRKFEWQDEYFALSVSESILNKVRNYIKNQEEHHKKKTFQNEYDEIIEKYNIQIFK
ncbi:MAG: IS200/IS605 family transposase [Flavobacterium sp.]|uniref:IS200/IS605 family transposase n=1 Tax=Flavobacterium sp. TaxID=239 RepID=UPI003263DC4F